MNNNLKDWKLIKKIPNRYPNESSSDFFIFQKSSGHNIYPTRAVKKRAIIDRVERRLLLLINPLYNFYYILKKWKQVIAYYSLRKEFFDLYDVLIKKDISIFLTPHWLSLNSKFENYFRNNNNNIPFGFLKNKLIGFAMFVSGGSKSMKTELDNLRQIYSEKELRNLLEEEAVGLPIITDIKHGTSHNSIRHLYHIVRFATKTKININSINSVLEWGGGYGNFARIFLKVRHFPNGFTYTIIDTPLFSCIQWLYLSAVLGKDKVNIIKNETCSIVEGKINIVPIEFIEKINATPDLFVSTWALSESSVYSQDYVLSKDFWFAKHLLIAYQESNEDLPNATRLGTIVESSKKVIKERISFMTWPNYYLFS
jgi:putative sugar O-methyltransferase